MGFPSDEDFEQGATLARVQGQQERRDAIAVALAEARAEGRSLAGGADMKAIVTAWDMFMVAGMGETFADVDADDPDEVTAALSRAADIANGAMKLRKRGAR